MAIRYDPVFQEEIKRVVSNFNRKVTRLEKQNRKLIPEKVSVSELKSSYDSRYELKRKLKQLQKFSTRGIEDIVKTSEGSSITKYDIAILKQEKARAIRKTKKEIARLTPRMDKLYILRRSPLNLEEDRLEFFRKDIEDMDAAQIRRLKSNINRVLDYDKKAETFQANFLQMLLNEAGMSGADEEVVNNIVDTLTQLTPEQLVKLYKEDSTIQSIADYSPTKGNLISSSRMRDILGAINDRLPAIMSDYTF